MSETPEEIRARIERTRAEVSGDVDALAEKVSPSSAVNRQTTRVKAAMHDMKDRVFGADDRDPGMVGDIGHGIRDTAEHVGDDVRHTAERAVRKAQGNPLAVGLIAFGVGALVASMLPSTSKEQELAGKVKEQAQPLVDEVKDVAKEAGEHLKEPAQQAAQAVKETAMDAGQHVKDEAQSAADDVRSDAERARDRVQQERGQGESQL
jgi:gas vesicle protein